LRLDDVIIVKRLIIFRWEVRQVALVQVGCWWRGFR